MRTQTIICATASLVALSASTPALAAKRVAVKLECSASRLAWSEPREFVVAFERTPNRLRDVTIEERARVFTPTDAAAIYVAQKKGGVITDVPNQRPGKWEGKPSGESDEFTLKTRDGSASFALAPDAADPNRRLLTWKAEMTGADAEALSAQGEGSCRVVSTEVDAPPAPQAEASPAPMADAPVAPKRPKKEIRIFGRRKGASTNGGEASE